MRRFLTLVTLVLMITSCGVDGQNGSGEAISEIHANWILKGSEESKFGATTLLLSEDGTYIWNFGDYQGEGNFTVQDNNGLRSITFAKDPLKILGLDEDSLILFQRQDTIDRTWRFYKER